MEIKPRQCSERVLGTPGHIDQGPVDSALTALRSNFRADMRVDPPDLRIARRIRRERQDLVLDGDAGHL